MRILLFLIVILYTGLIAVAGEGPSQKPNIVIFFSDDHSRADLGAYGSPDLHTPIIDALASEGMRFDNVIAPVSVCAPSRGAFYTGLYPQANGLHRNHGTGRADVKSIPHYLQALGYEVVLAGKVHVKPKKAYPFTYIERHEIPEFLEGAGDKPFALIIAYNMPHAPFLPKKGGYKPKKVTLKSTLPDIKETRVMQAAYYDMVDNLDNEIGADQFLLHRAGLLDEALQIYVSDHGYGFPNAKWTLYDEGLLVPMIVKWPGKIAPGSVSDRLVSLVDILPTLVEVAGGEPDASLNGTSFLPTLAGEDQPEQDHVFATYTNIGVKGGNHYPVRAIRTKTMKLIVNLAFESRFTTRTLDGEEDRVGVHTQDVIRAWKIHADGNEDAQKGLDRIYQRPAIQLFDLVNDPDEMNNLAYDPAHAAKVRRLYGLLTEWMAEQGDVELDLLRPVDQVLPVDVISDSQRR